MAGFPNYTYPAYGGYNPVTPFAPAPQIYQPMQQPSPQPVQATQTVGNTNTQPNFFCGLQRGGAGGPSGLYGCSNVLPGPSP